MDERAFYIILGIAFTLASAYLFVISVRFYLGKISAAAIYLAKGINFLFFALLFFALSRYSTHKTLCYLALCLNAGFWFVLDRKKVV